MGKVGSYIDPLTAPIRVGTYAGGAALELAQSHVPSVAGAVNAVQTSIRKFATPLAQSPAGEKAIRVIDIVKPVVQNVTSLEATSNSAIRKKDK